jgi:type IV pilus assembly protein PilE
MCKLRTLRKSPRYGANTAAGFTLVELMVVIIIATILIVIAVPSYMNQTLKSHRTDAKTAVLDLAGREERLMSTNGVYSATASQLGYSGTFPQTLPTGDYTITITNVNAAVAPTATTTGTPATFLITATATGNQTKDTTCQTFSIDQLGNQTSTNSSSATSTGCW